MVLENRLKTGKNGEVGEKEENKEIGKLPPKLGELAGMCY